MQAAGQGVQIALQDSDLHALSCSLQPIIFFTWTVTLHVHSEKYHQKLWHARGLIA